jgi:serine/threonine protein kinase
LVSRRRRPLRAAILYEVKHPNIVRVLEAQYDPDIDNAITFVTVYCEGKSIADALDEGYRFSIHQALALTTQVLSALAHVQTALKIIHRDPKPGNVFLDGGRRTGSRTLRQPEEAHLSNFLPSRRNVRHRGRHSLNEKAV